MLFWTHLVAGVLSGIVVFIMSFTGAAIAFQPQILLWAERDIRRVEPPSEPGTWLGPDALLAKVRDARPGMAVTGLVLERDRTQAAAVTLTSADRPGESGAAPPTTVYVDPYTGAVTGQLDPTTPWRRFFRVNTDWHRWLAMSGEQRNTGRWITGVSNAAFLLLALTGLYIWVPRVWSAAALKAVLVFRGGVSGKARDFNWHNVIGVWSAGVLVILTFTAMGISFPKTYDLIHAVTGIERPPAPAAASAPSRRPSGGLGTVERPNAEVRSKAEAANEARPPAGLDRYWQIAEERMPSWRSINLRLPQRDGQPIVFTMNDRERLNPMARSTLTIDANAVVRWDAYDMLTTGQRLRTWMRFGHTGELFGLPGQAVAGVASAGGCVLVYTGLALAWRRFRSWRTRRQRPDLTASGCERPAA
jgi:uncharacterized iron-regulated membrane protein